MFKQQSSFEMILIGEDSCVIYRNLLGIYVRAGDFCH